MVAPQNDIEEGFAQAITNTLLLRLRIQHFSKLQQKQQRPAWGYHRKRDRTRESSFAIQGKKSVLGYYLKFILEKMSIHGIIWKILQVKDFMVGKENIPKRKTILLKKMLIYHRYLFQKETKKNF